MELQSQEGDEMPLPLNSTYGGGHAHMMHQDHIIIPSSATPVAVAVAGGGGGPHIITSAAGPPISSDDIHHAPFKKPTTRYRECLKNHAAAMGGNATDGCGEFMPSGEDGTLESLTCSACNCHRNFHRKETDGDNASSCDGCYQRIGSRKLFVGHPHKGYDSIGYHHAGGGALISSRPPPPHHMIMSYNMSGGGGGGGGPSESDEMDGGMMARPSAAQMVKKRFRTKFSQEQKEKMLNFAEKVGWKIQKQEEGVVQQFCQEIGVKRRVLKVWMHNNKHTLAKKSEPQHQDQNQTTP